VGDWFDALPAHLRGTFDLIVSNPPYVARSAELPDEVAAWEPVGALWSDRDGTADLRRIVAGAPDWLVPGGVLVCELSPEQAHDMVELAGAHFELAAVEPDLTGRPRALVAKRPRR
jgi:release factor glutamine methyltransferase